jgi:hypothetical protein
MRPFEGVTWLGFLDYLPPLVFAGLAGYCFYRAPKQPEPIQKIVMGLFGGLCLALAAGVALPFALPASKAGIHGAFWFLAKVIVYIYAFMWFRFTFPRFRFDQLMKLGWYFLIPLSIVNVVAIAAGLVLARPAQHGGLGWPMWIAALVVNAGGIVVAGWLIVNAREQEQAQAQAQTQEREA